MLRTDVSTAVTDASRFRIRSNCPPLPPGVLGLLGQQLRSAYYETSERPQYVGDTALPLAFDPYLDRLHQKEHASRLDQIRQVGLAAVASALDA